MKNSAFDLAEHLRLREVTYKVSPILWKKWDDKIDLKFSNWKVMKYLNEDGSGLNPDISTIPTNKGGLYMFFANCRTISGITEFPFYIGRAQLTKGQNLRKRVREYFTKYAREGERPKITTMFRYWSNELFLAYIEIEENDEIIDLEKKLINSLLLPMNDEIPDMETKQAKKAFEI